MKNELFKKKDDESDESIYDEFDEDDDSISFVKYFKLMKYEKWNILEDLMRKSIKLDFDIDTIDEECGLSILAYASKEGRVYLSEKIIEYGSSVNLTLKDNKTALHHAVLTGKDDIVRLLIKKNANTSLETVEHYFLSSY